MLELNRRGRIALLALVVGAGWAYNSVYHPKLGMGSDNPHYSAELDVARNREANAAFDKKQRETKEEAIARAEAIARGETPKPKYDREKHLAEIAAENAAAVAKAAAQTKESMKSAEAIYAKREEQRRVIDGDFVRMTAKEHAAFMARTKPLFASENVGVFDWEAQTNITAHLGHNFPKPAFETFQSDFGLDMGKNPTFADIARRLTHKKTHFFAWDESDTIHSKKDFGSYGVKLLFVMGKSAKPQLILPLSLRSSFQKMTAVFVLNGVKQTTVLQTDGAAANSGDGLITYVADDAPFDDLLVYGDGKLLFSHVASAKLKLRDKFFAAMQLKPE